MSVSHRLRRAAAIGAVGLTCVLGVSGSASASTGDTTTTESASTAERNPLKYVLRHLTEEQRTCLKDAGVTLPNRPLTVEKFLALRDAADSCGIDLSPAKYPHLRHKVRAFAANLTPEQRSCMKDAGVTRPFLPVTIEKLQTLRSAAETCNVDLPVWAT